MVAFRPYWAVQICIVAEGSAYLENEQSLTKEMLAVLGLGAPNRSMRGIVHCELIPWRGRDLVST